MGNLLLEEEIKGDVGPASEGIPQAVQVPGFGRPPEKAGDGSVIESGVQDEIGTALDAEGITAQYEAKVLKRTLEATKTRVTEDGDEYVQQDYPTQLAALKHLHTLRRRDQDASAGGMRKLMQAVYVMKGGVVNVNKNPSV